MNIRFSIIAFVFAALVVAPAIAQPKATSKTQPTSPTKAGAAAVSSQQGGSQAQSSSSGLPNEKNLLIGGNQKSSSGKIKPVKQLGVWNYIQMVLVLGLVVGGIYLLFYFLKRMSGTRFQENSIIGVLSTKPLQANRSLHVVDVGGRLYLVGTSENSVNLVAAIEDKEAVDEIRLRASQSRPRVDHKAFRDVFAGAFRKGGSGGLGFGGSLMDSMGFMKQQRERLKKM